MSLPPPPVPSAATYVGPYATGSIPLAPMRSLRGLWISLLVLFSLVGVTDIVLAGAFFNRASLLDRLVDGDYVYQDLLDADDSVQGAMVAHVLLAVALAVVFIIWQFRHAKNAQALGERGGLGPGWAIGGWFVPIGNYVLPGIQIHQSSRLSDPAVAGRPGAKGKGAGIVIVWMALLATAAIVFIGGGGLRPTDDEGNVQINGFDDIEAAASSDRMAGAGMVLFVGAAVAGGMMVRGLSTKQAIAYQARLGAVPGAPPPPVGAPFYGGSPVAAPPPPGQWGTPAPSWSQPAPPVAPAPPPATEPPTQWGTPPP
jgi:hypothetical protein